MGIEDENKKEKPYYSTGKEEKEVRKKEEMIIGEKRERVYVVTNLEDGLQEVMSESKMKAHFSDEKDAENKGFKVEHHFGGLSIDKYGIIWGRADANYPNFVPKGDAVHDEVSEEDWREMEFVPDKK